MAAVATPLRLARPWPWLSVGLGLVGLALVGRTLAWDADALLLSMLALGLFLAGCAVALRFHNRAADADAPARPVRIILASVAAAFGAGLTYMFVASWFGLPSFTAVRPGLATVFWLLTAPLAACVAVQVCGRLQADDPLQPGEEAAALLLGWAAAACLAHRALPADWYTMTRFVAVAGWTAVVGALLAAAEQGTRRWTASAMILFHFLAITSATLSIPPSPWIFNQLWIRIARPYLEFTYLNNAYHFYSPEPGPASHLWFRLYFEDAQGQLHADWYKIPHVDAHGGHQHRTALIYQRHLSATENTTVTETLKIESSEYQQLLARRLQWTPDHARKPAVIGQEKVPLEQTVPMHPSLAFSLQYQRPNRDTLALIQSYARHVARVAAADNPDLTFKSLRMYRVVHLIPASKSFSEGWDPNDPQQFHSIYFGEFNAAGALRAPNDPLLYWMMPIYRDPPGTAVAPVRDWMRKHAGDPDWVRIVDTNGKNPRWVASPDGP